MQATIENLNKARDAQHEYLHGLVLDDKRNINTITCPCGEKIQWGHRIGSMCDGDTGKCSEKCGHEFIYAERYRNDAGERVKEDAEDHTKTIRTVYCRRKMNGDYLCHIGELVACPTKKMLVQEKKKFASYTVPDIPVDSPYFDVLNDVEELYMVIGVELSGDKVAISPLYKGELAGAINPNLAIEVRDGFTPGWQQPFWVPIEYLEGVSEWPYIDENE